MALTNLKHKNTVNIKIMENSDIQIVNSIDEITQPNIKYAFALRPSKYISIEKDEDNEYCIYGIICGDNPTFVTQSGDMVKNWKSFNGALRALKTYSKDNRWGMGHWNNKI